MRRPLAAAVVALAAGCGSSGPAADFAVYDVEADLRRAAGGPVRCEAPLACRGSRWTPRGEPRVTAAHVAAARAPGPETLLLDLTAEGSRRLDGLLGATARTGHHVAFVVDDEVLAYVAVRASVSSETGLRITTPRAKELARRLD